ncbi:MAG TPA: winged helix-turn-helix domain-containing protein [Syntrophomonadaceae bacterium]|nr:winged helix-turn-helix domain-containing protein [Syntrophomonadaceae bacterium]HQA07424.1 winged helix-turn-helix domain-containing protein [Syntrophomonadaceae bacterium]HQE23309.1 winged helix-turn-helix domain-containing protein [Syntrophomonadaceae bacterium]
MADHRDLLDLLIPMLELDGSAVDYPDYIQELVSEVRSDPVDQWFLQRCYERKSAHGHSLALQETAGIYSALTGDTKAAAVCLDLPQVDLKRAVVYTSQGSTWLTPAETRLLACLAQQPGVIVSHRTLSEIISQDYTGAVWAEPKYHIRNLRIKLGDNLQQPSIIRTRRGMGYYLDEKMKGRIVG